MTTQRTVRNRVQRGATWLNEHFPEWRGTIDAYQLDLENGRVCILGQCFGHFEEVVQDEEDDEAQEPLTNRQARLLGFDVENEDCNNPAAWSLLTEEWLRELASHGR